MSILKDLKPQVTIDGIGLSCGNKGGNEVYVGKVFGGYRRKKTINQKVNRPVNNSGNFDLRGKNYKWRFLYEHDDTGNILRVHTERLLNHNYIPPVYAFFYSSYDQPLGSIDVQYVLGDLRQRIQKGFHLSQIHLATDLITPNRINLFERVRRSINPLKKQIVYESKEYPGTIYFGSPRSSNQVVLYDKGEQLRNKNKKGHLVEDDVCRIEVRMKLNQLKNRIITLDELRSEGWASFIFGNLFSLDRPRHSLKALIGQKMTKMPLYQIKDIMRKQDGKLPDNFHRDYIREHRIFGPAVRDALASYKWN